ncbi:MAG: XRE family transcriptional regulator [Bdellovibrionota bacterium]
MKKTKNKKSSVLSNSKEIAKALGIVSSVDIALMEYKVLLSELATKAIYDSGLTVNEIVKRSDVARSKVSAIKNGALAGISSDLFLKVIAAAGGKVTFKLAG